MEELQDTERWELAGLLLLLADVVEADSPASEHRRRWANEAREWAARIDAQMAEKHAKINLAAVQR